MQVLRRSNLFKFTSLRSFATNVSNNETEIVRTTLKASDSRKTYLIDMYTNMWRENSIVLLAHHNNLISTENESIRKQIKKIDEKNGGNNGIQFRKLKGSIFKYFLRASEHQDPASKAAYRMTKRRKIRHPLENLLKGPTAAITIKDLNPKMVKEISKFLSTQKEKLFVIGGKVGDEYMTLQDIDNFKALQSLPELRAELVGLLTLASGGSLVRTLEASGNSIAMTLESRKNELEKSEKGDSEDSK